MADYGRPAFARPQPAVSPPGAEPCWLCGIRLPVTQMVADGGSACGNLRWYCLDVHGCTARWTVRARTPGAAHGDGEGTSSARAAAGA